MLGHHPDQREIGACHGIVYETGPHLMRPNDEGLDGYALLLRLSIPDRFIHTCLHTRLYTWLRYQAHARACAHDCTCLQYHFATQPTHSTHRLEQQQADLMEL